MSRASVLWFGFLKQTRRPSQRMELVKLNDLRLETGDTVLTSKGSFSVLERRGSDLEVVWLETARKATMWVEDSVHGPVEVLRKTSRD